MPVKKIIETMTPSFAASSVPAVVGDTNLFRLKLCMIKPAIPIPAPAKIIAIKRGSRLIKKICVSSEFQSSKSLGLISMAPMNSEIKDRTTVATTNIHNLICNPHKRYFLNNNTDNDYHY